MWLGDHNIIQWITLFELVISRASKWIRCVKEFTQGKQGNGCDFTSILVIILETLPRLPWVSSMMHAGAGLDVTL